MNPKKYFCVWLVLRDLKVGPKVVRHHLANHVTADRRLYLLSSVSSLNSMVEDNKGFVEEMESMEAAKAASLLKLLLFVAKGLKFKRFSIILCSWILCWISSLLLDFLLDESWISSTLELSAKLWNKRFCLFFSQFWKILHLAQFWASLIFGSIWSILA